MDAVALLHRAQEAGLRIEPMGEKLLVRGPKRAEAVVKLLAEYKAEVLAALAATANEVGLLAQPPLFGVSRNQQKVSLDLSSHAPLGADESKNLKERFCTSASSAERLGPSAMASVYVPGGPAAGTAPNIGQECGHEPAGNHTEPLGRRSTNAPLPRAAPAWTFVHQGPVAAK